MHFSKNFFITELFKDICDYIYCYLFFGANMWKQNAKISTVILQCNLAQECNNHNALQGRRFQRNIHHHEIYKQKFCRLFLLFLSLEKVNLYSDKDFPLSYKCQLMLLQTVI